MPLTGAFERDAPKSPGTTLHPSAQPAKSPGTAERAPGAGHAEF
jgi:hypothetical protein